MILLFCYDCKTSKSSVYSPTDRKESLCHSCTLKSPANKGKATVPKHRNRIKYFQDFVFRISTTLKSQRKSEVEVRSQRSRIISGLSQAITGNRTPKNKLRGILLRRTSRAVTAMSIVINCAKNSADSPINQSRRRSQRAEFFELQKQIAENFWSADHYAMFADIVERGLRDVGGEPRPFVKRPISNKSRSSMDLPFVADDFAHDAIFPKYLGKMKVFDFIPKRQISGNPYPSSMTPSEISGLTNGQSTDAKNRGDACLRSKMYREALSQYFEAIRLVPYKKAVFYSKCAVCYSHLGCHEVAMINSYMAVVVEPRSLDSWIHLGNAATKIIETQGLMHANHRVGMKEKDVAVRFAMMAHDAVLRLCRPGELSVTSQEDGLTFDLSALEVLIGDNEKKKMVSTLDDMYLLF